MNPYEKIINELATGLLEVSETKQCFSNNAMLDATLIFQTVFIDKIFDNQNYDNMPLEYRIEMVTKAGEDLRKLIYTYTNLDTVKLVDDYKK